MGSQTKNKLADAITDGINQNDNMEKLSVVRLGNCTPLKAGNLLSE